MSSRFPYSPVKQIPVPAVICDLQNPAGTITVSPVSAHLDTCADMTIVPLAFLQQLAVVPYRQLPAKGFGGTPYTLDVYQIRLVIPNVGTFRLDVLGHSDESFVLIGRDILNHFRITFDGPNQVTEFH